MLNWASFLKGQLAGNFHTQLAPLPLMAHGLEKVTDGGKTDRQRPHQFICSNKPHARDAG